MQPIRKFPKKSKQSLLVSNKVPGLRILGLASEGQPKIFPLRASSLLLSPEEGHHAKLGEYAASLWKEKAMTDVMVIVQSQEFKAHKAVLACYSPYFKEVLVKPGFNEVHYLQIPSVTARAFEILLEYMYTGDLKVSCQELHEVYRASRKLGIKGALERCIELLHVTSDHFQNMVYLYVTARKLDLLDASVRAFKLIVMHFERLVMTKEFLDLDIQQVAEIFNSDEIGARSEITVFLAALKWINHRYIDREEHISTVFAGIRFGLMNMEEILACYHPPILPGVMLRPAIREALLNATCYIAAKSLGQENLFAELAPRPRKFLFEGEAMILWDLSMYDKEKYFISRRYQAATRIQAFIRGHITRKHFREDMLLANYAATIIQSVYRGHCTRKDFDFNMKRRKSDKGLKISLRKNGITGFRTVYSPRTSDTAPEQPISFYVMGAFNAAEGEKGQNIIFKFDSERRKWEKITKCPVPHHDCRMVLNGNFLYVIGGYNILDRFTVGAMLPTKECYMFDLKNSKWNQICPMKHARCLHGAVMFDGSLCVVGGKDEFSNILSTIEKYDPMTDSWEEFLPGLPEPRMAMGVTAQDNILWVAGGITNEDENISLLNTVWCYDNMYSSWTKSMTLPRAVAFPTLLSDRRQLLIIGGATRPPNFERNELESISNVRYYENGRWLDLTQMLNPCHSVIACISGKNIFLLGGFSTQSMSQINEPLHFSYNESRWTRLPDIPAQAAGFLVAATSTRI